MEEEISVAVDVTRMRKQSPPPPLNHIPFDNEIIQQLELGSKERESQQRRIKGDREEK